jgi:multicomponent K+:H+ antiporter subunit E
MRTILPSPLISGALFLSWLLLNGSLSLGHLALALALAVGIPQVARGLMPSPVRHRAWGTAARLSAVVLYDIVASALVVARQILGPEERIRPEFFWVPLTIRDPYGIASLAAVITMTPGTLSADLSPDRRHLLVHALHVDDVAALIDAIKRRYEQPLIEIFDGTLPRNAAHGSPR